jgi:hypothetical protein
VGTGATDEIVLVAGGIEALTVAEGQYGTSANDITWFIPDLVTAPSTNPTGGVIIFSESDSLWIRDSSGTATDLGASGSGMSSFDITDTDASPILTVNESEQIQYIGAGTVTVTAAADASNHDVTITGSAHSTASDITMGGDISSTADTAQVDDVQSATANTEAADNNTTQVATTAFVQQEHDDSAGSCTNQVVTAVNASAAPTCSNVVSAMVTDDTITTGDLDDGADTPVEGEHFLVGGTTTQVQYAPPQPICKTLFDSGNLADTDDVSSIYRWGSPAIITEAWCEIDAGTNVQIDLVTSDGADNIATNCVCTTAGVSCSLTDTTMIDGEIIDLVIDSISGTVNRFTFCMEHRYDL